MKKISYLKKAKNKHIDYKIAEYRKGNISQDVLLEVISSSRFNRKATELIIKKMCQQRVWLDEWSAKEN